MASSTSKNLVRIYVRLLNEGTDVSRPTYATDLGEGQFTLLAPSNYDPEIETWEFLPGSRVRCQKRHGPMREYLLASHLVEN